MTKLLTTERLYLKEFTIDDAQVLIDLNSDPEVTRYTGDGPVKDLTEAKRILTDIIFPQYKNKMGRWAVYLNSTDEFIGWCGVKYVEDEKEYDLGYRFFKQHWGKGYASEAASAVMDDAINTLQLKEIIGRAAIDNKASIAVLKKMGMKYLKNDECGHDPAAIYIYKR